MVYNRQEDRIELSVRELCAMAGMSGHIDSRMPSVASYDRAREGTAAHRKIQESRGEGYHAEVALRNTCRLGELTFLVSGRADGVIYHPTEGCVVEEIKTATGAERYLSAPRGADLAQLSCYGYFLCCAKGLSDVTLRLTYADTDGEELGHTDALMLVDALKEAYVTLLSVVYDRAKDLRMRETVTRDEAAAALFPYPKMRAEQGDMIRECWRDLRRGQTVFAQAPTGIGKTISTLYPAVRCYGEDRCDKIFYLTAKSSTRREAVGAVERMMAAGTHVRACVIASREAACLCDAAKESGGRLSRFCHPDACPYAKGYYDRVEGVIQDLLTKGTGVFTFADIRAAAMEGMVCPYELALDLSERCEIIIADYNYVFSPSVYLRRYFADGIPHSEGHRYIFLVDEAHNLPDRARELYSGALALSDVMATRDALTEWERTQAQWAAHAVFPEEDGWEAEPQEGERRLSAASLDGLIEELSHRAVVCRESMTTGDDGVRRGVSLDQEAPFDLIETVTALSKKCDGWLRRHADHPMYATVDHLSSALRELRTAGDYYDHRYATLTEVEGEEVRLRLLCLDPAGIVGPILQRADARILFSATLTPAEYFADILGGGEDSVTVAFDSPFDPQHLCVAVADEISTRYEDRESSYRRVVSYLAAVVSAKKGNYMVYFPSYDYLEKVYDIFHKKYPSVKTVVQRAGMSSAERDAFIAAFTPEGKELQIGFCVLGGLFSEGVDLPGRSLIGVLVVGVGLPGLSNERNIIRAHYDERSEGDPDARGTGYDYAYTYPGMNHVLQAAGRVIRRDDDRGVVVLLDDRYAVEPYLSLYPAHWRDMRSVKDPTSLYEYLSRFWKNNLQDL